MFCCSIVWHFDGNRNIDSLFQVGAMGRTDLALNRTILIALQALEQEEQKITATNNVLNVQKQLQLVRIKSPVIDKPKETRMRATDPTNLTEEEDQNKRHRETKMNLDRKLGMKVILKEDESVEMAKVESRIRDVVVENEKSARLKMKPNKIMPNRLRLATMNNAKLTTPNRVDPKEVKTEVVEIEAVEEAVEKDVVETVDRVKLVVDPMPIANKKVKESEKMKGLIMLQKNANTPKRDGMGKPTVEVMTGVQIAGVEAEEEAIVGLMVIKMDSLDAEAVDEDEAAVKMEIEMKKVLNRLLFHSL